LCEGVKGGRKAPEGQNNFSILILEFIHPDNKIGATSSYENIWGEFDRVEDIIIPRLPKIP
jgi:hypothetical protein